MVAQNEQKCPCCDDVVLSDDRGSCYVCQVCYWQYDGLDIDRQDEVSIVNEVSLREARSNYLRFGACHERWVCNDYWQNDESTYDRIERELRADTKQNVSSLRKFMRMLSKRPDEVDRLALAHRARLSALLCKQAFRLYGRRIDRSTECELWKEAGILAGEAHKDATPTGLWEDIMLLKNGDQSRLEAVVQFLEVDPWYQSSGYMKEDILKILCATKVPLEYFPRLQAVVLSVVRTRDRREFRRYCRMATHIDAPNFREELERLRLNQDAGISRRARWVLESLELVRPR
jgi:hypothetical protein